MDPNPSRRLSAASPTGQSVDVRVNPGTLGDQRQGQLWGCLDCYTCPNCESICRDILLQKPPAEPDEDMWGQKDGICENLEYGNVMTRRSSPEFRTVGSMTPRFLPSIESLPTSAMDQSQHSSPSAMNDISCFDSQWNNVPLSPSMQMTTSSHVSGQALGAPSSSALSNAGDPGDLASSKTMKSSFPGVLNMHPTTLRTESLMNAQCDHEHPQPNGNANFTWWSTDPGYDVQPPADLYASKPGSENMVDNGGLSPIGLLHFNGWNSHGKDLANTGFESMENFMTDDNDNCQSSTASGSPSIESATPRLQCGTCHRSYKRKYDLQRHAKNHLGVKPHKCPFPDCQSGLKGFVRSDHLTQHLKNRHPDPS